MSLRRLMMRVIEYQYDGHVRCSRKKPSEKPTNRIVPSVTDVTILLELDAALSATRPSAS